MLLFSSNDLSYLIIEKQWIFPVFSVLLPIYDSREVSGLPIVFGVCKFVKNASTANTCIEVTSTFGQLAELFRFDLICMIIDRDRLNKMEAFLAFRLQTTVDHVNLAEHSATKEYVLLH